MKNINKVIVNQFGYKKFNLLLKRLNIKYTRLIDGSYNLTDVDVKKLRSALKGIRKGKRKNKLIKRKNNPLGLYSANERMFSGDYTAQYKK